MNEPIACGSAALPIAAPLAAMLPDWLPDDLRLYLRHVEEGVPIRALARAEGCHASTMLRRVRRAEARREDPLFDAALCRISRPFTAPGPRPASQSLSVTQHKENRQMTAPLRQSVRPDSDHLQEEARRVLRRLAEPGACLALARGMDKAVVMRGAVRIAVLDHDVAEAFALKDWIALIPPASERGEGRISRYRLTASGRAMLRDLMGETPGACGASMGGGVPRAGEFRDAAPVAAGHTEPGMAEAGMAEAAASFAGQGAESHRAWGERVLPDPETGRRRRMRVNLAESPLTMLARRRDKDGKPFLSDDLVAAGERLREDFELAQIGPRVAQNWERFLTGGGDRGAIRDHAGPGGSDRARDRVAAALRDLGPGLGDMVLRVCCFLEGIEATERKLGWSARSGKIVLRIALMRLRRHYDQAYGGSSPLIG